MRNTVARVGSVVLATTLALAPGARAQNAGAATAGTTRPGIEPRADAVLRAMSDRLAALPRFAFEAEETFDEIPDGAPRIQLTNVRRVAVARPNRIAADADGDTLLRATWYDGRTATILDKAHNTYGQVEVPPTIDAALDAVAERYGFAPPLVDFLYGDPYAVLSEGVRFGRYLGLHRAAGVPCHHLVFVQDTIEWQLWVDAADEPLPRKLVITYVREPGEPQYEAVLRKWNLAPEFPDRLFTFEAPPGAERVELSRLRPPGDRPGEGGGR